MEEIKRTKEYLYELKNHLVLLEELRQNNEDTMEKKMTEYKGIQKEKDRFRFLIQSGQMLRGETVKTTIEDLERYKEDLLLSIKAHQRINDKIEAEIHTLNHILDKDDIK
ncbi:MAG: hypothetical protein Q4G58_15640 [bacterium]|nr:hypothetical protein [bacterium]